MRPLFRNAYLSKSKKELQVKKFKVGGFSQTERRNLLLTPITSALLQARTMPGESQLGSLARAFGKGIEPIPQIAMNIKQIDDAAQERADRKKESKISKTKQVLDTATNNVVFKTEFDIQNTVNADNTPRFVPVPSKDAQVKPMKVFDLQEGVTTFVNPNDVLTTKYTDKDQEKLRYAPVGDEGSLVRAYKIQENGEFATSAGYYRKGDVLADPESYKPIEGNIEMMMKIRDIDRMKKQKNDADAGMVAANQAAKTIRMIENDIAKGAFTGKAADLTSIITGTTGFVDQFINRQKKYDIQVFNNDINATRREIDAILAGRKTINERVTRFLKAADSQGLKTSVINLSYLIAKAREPGGRFSVPDIELALESIGQSSNKISFLAGLKRTGADITRNALDQYKNAYDILEEDIPNKYRDLLDNFKYFGGYEIKEDELDPSKLPL